ncbi:MAG: TRAP transporter large permease subunit, partial [Gammaproteobacteria bacterium]|nr:TRAP transporter large permease subunit [Gammaproteobacteria bacterium]
LSYVGDSKMLGLLAVMLVSIVLGMGVPTVAAYLVAAAAAGPALVKLGFPLLSAHMFIFYYAVLATMTPPVAASAFAAGALAGAHPMQVGFMAVRLGIAAYIVPFLFVYGDSLLMQGSWGGIGLAVATALFGMYALARCVIDQGISLWRRGVLGVASLLLILTDGLTDVIGLVVLGLGLGGDLIAWYQKTRNEKQKEDALEESS